MKKGEMRMERFEKTHLCNTYWSNDAPVIGYSLTNQIKEKIPCEKKRNYENAKIWSNTRIQRVHPGISPFASIQQGGKRAAALSHFFFALFK